MFEKIYIIKNVSSSSSHKKLPSLRLSKRLFKKILPNTFIYECLHFEYTNISFNQVWPQRSLKVTKGHFYVYFNLNLPFYRQLFVLVLICDVNKSNFICIFMLVFLCQILFSEISSYLFKIKKLVVAKPNMGQK